MTISRTLRPWKIFWKSKLSRFELIATIVVMLLTLNLFKSFVQFVEFREGAELPDPILRAFQPIDFTWPTFTLIYGCLIFGIWHLSAKPGRLLLGCQTYTLMLTLRILTMWITPFNPPSTMIPLHDPFVELFGPGKTLTKDLFFSGHTATLFMLCLVSYGFYYRLFFFICTILVAGMVLLQHVHYTTDVVVAPFVTFASFKLMSWKRD